MPVRELLFCWYTGTLSVLVPFKNGQRYLKVPAGHHRSDKIAELEKDLGCDVWGLDGTLDLQCGAKITSYLDVREAYAAKAMPLVAKAFDCDSFREIGTEEMYAKLMNPEVTNAVQR